MDESKALTILTALANGIDPLSGEIFPAGSVYQSADVARALYLALRALEQGARKRSRSRGDVSGNAGKPWSDDEDRRLLAGFDTGRSVTELAQAHARTPAGIQARLERHGRLPATTAGRPSLYRRTGGNSREPRATARAEG